MVGWLNIMNTYITFRDLPVYQHALQFSNEVWFMIAKWEWVPKRTIGCQFINAADSISANIAEGFGRYHKKDKIKFYYNTRGSAYESIDWISKSNQRRLLTTEDYQNLNKNIDILPHEINSLISYTNRNLKI